MPFREALFWIGIAMLGPGLYFWIEDPQRIWGPILTAMGAAGIIWSIVRGRDGGGPLVEALRYDIGPDDQRQGVYITARRAPSYEVQIKPITLIGGWTLHFDDVISRLEGDGFLPGIVSRANHHEHNLDAVWRRLQETVGVPAVFPLDLRYRDANGRWYSSFCELHRDVTKPHAAFDVKFVRRRKMRRLFSGEKP